MITQVCLTILLTTAAAASTPTATDRGLSTSEKEFCRIDTDQDRSISFEEFSACEFHKLEQVRKLPYADPELFGPEQSRELSEDELKRYLFKRADRNNDLKVDRKEWEDFYQSLIEGR